MKTLDLSRSLREKIAKDIKICEDNIKYFSSENKYAQAIQRSLNRIKKLLDDFENIKEIQEANVSTLRHDLRNALASAFGYIDLMKMKAKDDEEKQYAENISKSLRNILDKITS